MTPLTYGKHAGKDPADIPKDYLDWLIKSREAEIADFKAELERRELVEMASISMVERIAAEGYRSLAKKLHPDTGGRESDFKDLKAASEQLKTIIGDFKHVTGSSTSRPF